MLVELTWNYVLIIGRKKMLDIIEEKVFKDGLSELTTLKITSLGFTRVSPSLVELSFDSNGELARDFLLKLSSDYKLNIRCKYEDDSMDIGGTFICKSGKIVKDLSYTYLVHRYKEGGIDDIVLDVEEYVKEGETFEDFMSMNGLWAFVSKGDKELIESMFNRE